MNAQTTQPLLSPWKAWKTIKIGGGESTKELLVRLCISFWISSWLREFLFKAQVSQKESEVDLVGMSVAELGTTHKHFGNQAVFSDIRQKAKLFGLELCSLEIALRLRDEYRDQPLDQRLYIAIEPIRVEDGSIILELGNDGKKSWLAHEYVSRLYQHLEDEILDEDHEESVFLTNSRFVFVKPRQ